MCTHTHKHIQVKLDKYGVKTGTLSPCQDPVYKINHHSWMRDTWSLCFIYYNSIWDGRGVHGRPINKWSLLAN